MSQPDVTAIVQDYVSAWSEPQEDVRQRLLQRVWTDEGVYSDPTVYGEGRERLNQIIGTFHQRAPGSQFQLISGIDAHHGFVRFAWKLTFGNGATMQGMDFGEVAEDGRLHKIVGFF
jgi:hypothetical protein